MDLHRIAVIAFNHISPFHLSVPDLVFGGAQHPSSPSPFEIRVCAVEKGPLQTTSGFTLQTLYTLKDVLDADTIIIPSWRDPLERPSQSLIDTLCESHARGTRLVGLCLGAFVLGETGLLDGRNATTHWLWAAVFAQRFPKVQVDPEVLYVEDQQLITSAGTVAGIDCCLYLLRQHCGAEVANRVARRIVTTPHRHGNQAQFIEQPVPMLPKDHRLAELLVWLQQHLDTPHTLDALAERVLMSRRTFTRHFQQLTGTTVGEWLRMERLRFAQRLLETSNQSIEQIAQASGFGSAVSMRQHFTTALGLSPKAYRHAFRGPTVSKITG